MVSISTAIYSNHYPLERSRKMSTYKFLDRDFSHCAGFPCCADPPNKEITYFDRYFGGVYGLCVGTFCAPCVVGRAFELLHPQFSECSPCDVTCFPRTCLGCAMCWEIGMMPWALAYVGSHSRKQDNPVNLLHTIFLVCAGSFCALCCCAPCQIAGEIERAKKKGRKEETMMNLLSD